MWDLEVTLWDGQFFAFAHPSEVSAYAAAADLLKGGLRVGTGEGERTIYPPSQIRKVTVRRRTLLEDA